MVRPGGTTAPAWRRTDTEWRGGFSLGTWAAANSARVAGVLLWAVLGLHRRVVVEFFWAHPRLQPPPALGPESASGSYSTFCIITFVDFDD
jgi:hypothetical protein